MVHNFTRAIKAYIEVLHEKESPSTLIALRDWDAKVRLTFYQCTMQFGFEACVNMDAALRKDCRFTVTVCIFDRATGKNLVHSLSTDGFESVQSCHKVPNYRSHEWYLGIPTLSHSSNPTPTHSPSPGEPIYHYVPVGESHFSSYNCETSHRTDRNESNSKHHGHEMHPSGFGTYGKSSRYPGSLPTEEDRKNSAGTVQMNNLTDIPLTIYPSQPHGSFGPSSSTGRSDARMTEGCVSVHHLQGYALQHKADLARNVLCSRGFCATPNHAIIVGEKWTSIRKLCAKEWVCTKHRMMVNNLDIFVNRRANAGQGVVNTPHDILFPICFTWIAQGIGKLWG